MCVSVLAEVCTCARLEVRGQLCGQFFPLLCGFQGSDLPGPLASHWPLFCFLAKVLPSGLGVTGKNRMHSYMEICHDLLKRIQLGTFLISNSGRYTFSLFFSVSFGCWPKPECSLKLSNEPWCQVLQFLLHETGVLGQLLQAASALGDGGSDHCVVCPAAPLFLRDSRDPGASSACGRL